MGQPFLRSMLRDRFKLQAHFEKRPLPLYCMTVARADGALGAFMKASEPYDCADMARARLENPSEVLMLHPGHPTCIVMSVPNHIAGGSVPPAVLAQALRGPVGAPVVDHTGLTGVFDVDIFYTSQAQGLAPTDPRTAAQIAQWPTLITAIQDQLGLKLERHTEPQDVLVVDHIEPPTPD